MLTLSKHFINRHQRNHCPGEVSCTKVKSEQWHNLSTVSFTNIFRITLSCVKSGSPPPPAISSLYTALPLSMCICINMKYRESSGQKHASRAHRDETFLINTRLDTVLVLAPAWRSCGVPGEVLCNKIFRSCLNLRCATAHSPLCLNPVKAKVLLLHINQFTMLR